MPLPREEHPARLAHLGFSMEMPMNFPTEATPAELPDFTTTSVAFPLLLKTSIFEECFLAVAARPVFHADASGRPCTSVQAMIDELFRHFRLTATERVEGMVGGLLRRHPAILIRAVGDGPNGQRVHRMAVLEDGGYLITVHSAADAALEESYLSTLVYCIGTFELTTPEGPTMPLKDGGVTPAIEAIEHDPSRPAPRDASEVFARQMEAKRDAALSEARPLAARGAYDDAERRVLAADSSIMGSVALGQMYTELLEAAVAKRVVERKVVEELFRRALQWRTGAYPDPHTEYEADDYAEGRERNRAELVAILGYDAAAVR